MNCQQASHQLHEYLDQEISQDQAKIIWEHLNKCRHCFSSYEFEKAMKRLVEKYGQSPKISEQCRKNILKIVGEKRSMKTILANKLNRFKRLFFSALLLFCLASVSSLHAEIAYDATHQTYAQVLTQFSKETSVNYAALKKNPENLERYLKELASVKKSTFESWSQNERLAFLINLYNAQTLKLIIDHYPTRSIRDIGNIFMGPWDRKVVKLFGKFTTLNVLEHDKIRKEYNEPRIHFALVCAAKSCPPLRAEPYIGSRLEEQLNDQARRFLSDTTMNRWDSEKQRLRLSMIFKWFKKDFLARAKDLKTYVLPYFPPEIQRQIQAQPSKVSFVDYDWDLNDSKMS